MLAPRTQGTLSWPMPRPQGSSCGTWETQQPQRCQRGIRLHMGRSLPEDIATNSKAIHKSRDDDMGRYLSKQQTLNAGPNTTWPTKTGKRKHRILHLDAAETRRVPRGSRLKQREHSDFHSSQQQFTTNDAARHRRDSKPPYQDSDPSWVSRKTPSLFAHQSKKKMSTTFCRSTSALVPTRHLASHHISRVSFFRG